MKKTTLIQSIVAAVFLSGSAVLLTAQDTTPACPLGFEPGYGRSLTPGQRVAHRAAMRYEPNSADYRGDTWSADPVRHDRCPPKHIRSSPLAGEYFRLAAYVSGQEAPR